jgi:hypothetical protein
MPANIQAAKIGNFSGYVGNVHALNGATRIGRPWSITGSRHRRRKGRHGARSLRHDVRFSRAFGDTVNFDPLSNLAMDEMSQESSNPVFGLNALGGALNSRRSWRLQHHGGSGTIPAFLGPNPFAYSELDDQTTNTNVFGGASRSTTNA